MSFVDGLPESAIWDIGDFTGSKRGKLALARADLASRIIGEVGLALDPDAKGHPRHVNIRRWPTSKDEQEGDSLGALR